MDIYKYSSTPRPLDKKYLTNRIIGLAVPLVIIGSFLYQLVTGTGLLDALLWGTGGGLVVFLSWALCREMDPDNDYSALLAAIFSLAGIFLLGIQGIPVMILYLFSARILVRTTGIKAKWADSVLLLLLGTWIAFTVHGIFLLTVFTIFILDAILKAPLKKQYIFAVLSLLVFFGGLITGEFNLWEGTFFYYQAIAGTLLALLFVPVIISSRSVRSIGDVTGKKLQGIRLQLILILLIISGLLHAIIDGDKGLAFLFPFWACVTGIVVYRAFKFLWYKI